MISSAGSKATALGLQAISIPLVLHSLGVQRYAVYLMVTAVLAVINLTQFGAGPGLTQAIARANAHEKHEDEGAFLFSALLFSAAVATLGALAIWIVVEVVPADRLFGSDYGAFQSEILRATQVGLILLIANVIFGVVDSALAGYQEQVLTNTASAINNVVCAVLLWWVCRGPSSIVVIASIVYGVGLLSKLCNLIYLLKRRRYLLSGWRQVRRSALYEIMNVGIAFWFVQCAAIVEQNAGTFILGHLATPEATVAFGVVYKVAVMAGAVVGIFTQPVWPAVADAVSRHDLEWIRVACSRLRRHVMAAALVLSLGLLVFGPWMIRHFLRVDLAIPFALFAIMSIFLFSNLWTHFHYVLMFGMQKIWQVVGVLIVEISSIVIISSVLVRHFSSLGMASGYLFASLALPAWFLPKMLNWRLSEIAVEPVKSPATADACSGSGNS